MNKNIALNNFERVFLFGFSPFSPFGDDVITLYRYLIEVKT